MQMTRFVRFLFMAVLLLTVPLSSFAGVFLSVTIAPPVLPVYTQPVCPGNGYMWTPGYWAYGPDGYYWVPGTWALPPQPGLRWTPGYWGWTGGAFVWHVGFWGPHVGFYGGVNYGFGYVGVGFFGGEWRGGTFYYNRSVTNINVTNVHIYNKTVINNVVVNHVSYNGGAGGINARPTPEEERAMNEHHFAPTGLQLQHEHTASTNRELLASVNHGRPAVAATARPGEFHGGGVVAGRAPGGPARPENRPPQAMNRNVPRPQNNVRPTEERAGNARESVPRPAAYHGENNRPQAHANPSHAENNRTQAHTNPSHGENNRPQSHENVPRPAQEKHEEKSPDQKGR
jgi:hypothetical protein